MVRFKSRCWERAGGSRWASKPRNNSRFDAKTSFDFPRWIASALRSTFCARRGRAQVIDFTYPIRTGHIGARTIERFANYVPMCIMRHLTTKITRRDRTDGASLAHPSPRTHYRVCGDVGTKEPNLQG